MPRKLFALRFATANLRTNIMDFRGFDSSTILILRGGMIMSIGYFPESLSQAILVGIVLVGRLWVYVVQYGIGLDPGAAACLSRYNVSKEIGCMLHLLTLSHHTTNVLSCTACCDVCQHAVRCYHVL